MLSRRAVAAATAAQTMSMAYSAVLPRRAVAAATVMTSSNDNEMAKGKGKDQGKDQRKETGKQQKDQWQDRGSSNVGKGTDSQGKE